MQKSRFSHDAAHYPLTLKVPNTVDPAEVPHNEQSYLDLQCLPSCFWNFNIILFELKDFFLNFEDVTSLLTTAMTELGL